MILRTLASAAVLALPTAMMAQATCTPAADTPEAKLLAFFGGPLAFSAVPGTSGLGRGEIALAGELALMPQPPAAISRSSGACGFNKAENSDLAPVFPRPRVAVGLGGGLAAELSWLPPVTVADATPRLGGVAVSWTLGTRLPVASASLTVRAHTTLGGVDGPITCPRKQLQTTNSAQDCYGTKPSEDTYEPNVTGVEAVAHATALRWGWYAGLGVSALASRLQVNFTDSRGFVDRNVVKVDLTRVAMLGGVTFDAIAGLAVSAQVYAVPSDATTGRLGLSWRAR